MIKKLRNLLSTSKDRNSTSFDNKLSLPELFTQKCPAPPNPYFCNSADTVGAEQIADKKDLICVDGTTMKPCWRRNSKTDSKQEKLYKTECDADKATKTYSELCKVSLPAATKNITSHDVSTDKYPTVGVDLNQKGSNLNHFRNGGNGGGSKTVANQPHISLNHIVQQTVKPLPGGVQPHTFPPEATESQDVVADDKMISQSYRNSPNRSSFLGSNNSNVHNYYNGFDDTTQFHLDSSKVRSFFNSNSASTSWNASGACRVTNSNLVADALSCSCGQCHPTDKSVKDCDWGWFTNSSANNVSRRSSIDINDNPKSPRTDLDALLEQSSSFRHRYVNETSCAEEKSQADAFGLLWQSHSRSDCDQCSAESKMAFTIMEGSGGHGLQVTIKGAGQETKRFSQSCSSNHSNMTTPNPSRTGSLWMQAGPDNSVNKISARHPSQESSFGSMAPSFPLPRQGSRKYPENSAIRRQARQQQNKPKENVNNNSTKETAATNRRTYSKKSHKNAPNFELTMKSYSKLIAYFDTNKLLISSSGGHGKRHASSRSLSRVDSDTASPMNNPTSSHVFSQQSFTKLPWNPRRDGASCSSTQSTSSSPDGQVLDLCRLAKVLETVEECPWYWGAMTGQDSKVVLRDSPPGTFLLRDSSDPRFLFSLSIKTKQGPTSIRIIYTDGAFRFDSEMDDATAGHHRNASSRSSPTSRDYPNYVKRLTPVFTCVINMVLFYTNHLGLSMPCHKTCDNNNSSTAAKENKQNSQDDRCEASAAAGGAVSFRSGEEVRPSTVPTSRRSEQFMCYWVNRYGRQEIPVLLAKPKTQGFPSLQRLCRQSLNRSQKLWLDDSKIDQYPLPNSLKKYIKKYPYPV